MDSLPFPRPLGAAARAAALRAKMTGARPPMGSVSHQNHLVALDSLESAAEKWLECLNRLGETALKQQRRFRGEESASSDERVHKTPLQRSKRVQAEDVVMKDAPAKITSDNSSAKSVGSNERIRPATPPNLPRLQELPKSVAVIRDRETNPTSPPAGKFEDLDIKQPIVTSPPHVEISSVGSETAKFEPLIGANAHPSLSEPSMIHNPRQGPLSSSNPVEIQITSSELASGGVAGPQEPDPVGNNINLPDANLRIKSDSLSTSGAKKRRLSSRTLLDSLMDKKARNPIWYDGVTQKVFHDLVFEMSQQIQSMKRERRAVMFAKDPACGELLEKLDNTIQRSLKSVELSSFLFLKGKPDIKEMEGVKKELKESLSDITDFRKSGWTMNNDDEDSDGSESEDDEGSD